MPVPTYRSYCFTVNPSQGVTPEMESALIKFCNSTYFIGSQMVIEKDGPARHAHIQTWTSEPKVKGDINNKLERVLKPFILTDNDYKAQIRVLRNGTKIAYNNWINTYCLENDIKENDISILVVDNRPSDSEDYYPSEEEQNKCKRQANAVDQRLQKLELMFEEWWDQDTPISHCLIAAFLCDLSFRSRQIAVMMKYSDRRNLVCALYHYITKSHDATFFYKPKDTKIANELRESGCTEEEIENLT